MKITSAKFVKGVVAKDPVLEDGKPQVAFIGRSNVGKSTLINSLTNQRGLARTSSFPGRTQEINLFLINENFYLVDLPGYGFARNSAGGRERIQELINSYLFRSHYKQKLIVLIIDANVGPTEGDLDMLHALVAHKKNVIVIANKIDKIKKSEYVKHMRKIESSIGGHTIIPYSSKSKIGIKEVSKEILE